MNAVTIYKDICTEIEILEMRLQDLDNILKAAQKVYDTGKMPGEHPVYLPLDKTVEQLERAREQYQLCDIELRKKELIKRKIEENIERFQGLKYKVAYMRDIEDKPLLQISQELNYSYKYIQAISASIPRVKVI